MKQSLFQELDRVLRQRNPRLSDRMQPGLPEKRILKILERADVHGNVEPIVALFSWRNGSDIHGHLSLEQASPFPGSVYIFMPLEAMVADYKGFEECQVHHPGYAKLVGQYFPIFWDGSNSWLAVDLNKVNNGRVVLIHTEFEQMLFVAYDSFGEFLNDAIRANAEDDNLVCFSSLKPLL